MRIPYTFFARDILTVAPELLGKYIVRQFCADKVIILRFKITEVEAYRGEEDLACHASKGRTARTEVMYGRGGLVYVYLIYGAHYMLNFVAGGEGEPQAALIRGVEEVSGPGRVARLLEIDKSFYGEDLCSSQRIWLEDGDMPTKIIATPRIGIDYAGEWKDKLWRFSIEQ
jgi:DNA-3-methyladenine glycosylase